MCAVHFVNNPLNCTKPANATQQTFLVIDVVVVVTNTQQPPHISMGSTLGNKNSRIALGLFSVAFILIFISFATPYWLVSDGKLEHPKFLHLGKFFVQKSKRTDTAHV